MGHVRFGHASIVWVVFLSRHCLHKREGSQSGQGARREQFFEVSKRRWLRELLRECQDLVGRFSLRST